MGICTSKGVIRDFAGPYMVGEGRMAFGRPVKYWRLKPWLVPGGEERWDNAVKEASDIYMGRMVGPYSTAEPIDIKMVDLTYCTQYLSFYNCERVSY